MYANHPQMAEEWEIATGKRKLPKRKTKPTTNAKRSAPNPLRIDPTRTITLRRHFIAQLRRQFALLKGRIIKLIVDEDALGLIQPTHALQLNEADISVAKQAKPWSCGAAVVSALTGWDQEEAETILGTTRKDGTSPQAIASALGSEPREGMTIQQLQEVTDDGTPVVCAIQAWGSDTSKDNNRSGHYVIVTKVDDDDVHFMDPAVGRERKLSLHDFESVWHDEDADGTEWNRLGIVANSNPEGCNQYSGPGCSAGLVISQDGIGTFSGKVFRGGDLREDSGGTFGAGYYFTTEHEVAVGYALPYNAPVHEFHISTGKLFLANGYDHMVDPVRKEWKESHNGQTFSSTKEQANAVREYYRKRGFVGAATNEHYLSRTDTIVLFDKPSPGSGNSLTSNNNPEGCNQYKSCGGGSYHAKALEAIRGIKSKIAGTLSDYVDKVPGGKRLREKLAGLNDKLAERYGASTAKTILASAQVISWGAFTAGLATGHTVYIPSWGLTVVGAVLAEGYLQAHRGFKKLTGNEAVDIDAEGQRLYDQLVEDWKSQPISNARQWQFNTGPEKLRAFQAWLKQQLEGTVQGQTQHQLWDRYIQDGFRKGAGRSFDDVRYAQRAQSAGNQRKLDFYDGTREEFLRSSFAQPVAREKVELLAGRAWDELDGMSGDMGNRLGRALTDGLVQGKGPHEVARDLVKQVDISRNRAELIARTELIRAHAEGQLVALKNLGVDEIGVMVEWTVTEDEVLCPECAAMAGSVFKIDDAHGLIPAHPNCRCAFLPAGVGEDTLNFYILNVFCPTGKGGGKDPSCSWKYQRGALPPGMKPKGSAKVKAAPPTKTVKPVGKVVKKVAEDKPRVEKSVAKAVDKPAKFVIPESAPVKIIKEVKSGRTATAGGGSRAVEAASATVSRPVAPAPPRSQPPAAGKGGAGSDKPAGDRSPQVIPADKEVVQARLDRFEGFFRSKGDHQTADWMGKLREHVEKVGTTEALRSLGEEKKGTGSDREVRYEHERGGFESMGHFAEAYLGRHGIVSVHRDPGLSAGETLISSSSPAFGGTRRGRGGDFTPSDPTLPHKLAEAKALPGLERSEDVNHLLGHSVTHMTEEVVGKLDEHYGKDKWIVKPYKDEAFNSQVVYFPQRVQQIKEDARGTLHSAEGELGKHGFSLQRNDGGQVVGIKHTSGDEYQFGSEKYNNTIYGHARDWGDRAASAAQHEQGAKLPTTEGENPRTWAMMAQPAFEAVGVSNADRAAGRTIAPGEGRVHIVTRDGKAEIVPHSTWIKGEHLPVVFESAETRAMAKAAVDAVNALPKSERQGQIYAPDVIKARGGYKVVEANPANDTGSSGYLGDNPLVIDSYVSHLTGREPAHVKFIRKLLSKRTENVLYVPDRFHLEG